MHRLDSSAIGRAPTILGTLKRMLAELRDNERAKSEAEDDIASATRMQSVMLLSRLNAGKALDGDMPLPHISECGAPNGKGPLGRLHAAGHFTRSRRGSEAEAAGTSHSISGGGALAVVVTSAAGTSAAAAPAIGICPSTQGPGQKQAHEWHKEARARHGLLRASQAGLHCKSYPLLTQFQGATQHADLGGAQDAAGAGVGAGLSRPLRRHSYVSFFNMADSMQGGSGSVLPAESGLACASTRHGSSEQSDAATPGPGAAMGTAASHQTSVRQHMAELQQPEPALFLDMPFPPDPFTHHSAASSKPTQTPQLAQPEAEPPAVRDTAALPDDYVGSTHDSQHEALAWKTAQECSSARNATSSANQREPDSTGMGGAGRTAAQSASGGSSSAPAAVALGVDAAGAGTLGHAAGGVWGLQEHPGQAVERMFSASSETDATDLEEAAAVPLGLPS